jgi:hypothetical protein
MAATATSSDADMVKNLRLLYANHTRKAKQCSARAAGAAKLQEQAQAQAQLLNQATGNQGHPQPQSPVQTRISRAGSVVSANPDAARAPGSPSVSQRGSSWNPFRHFADGIGVIDIMVYDLRAFTSQEHNQRRQSETHLGLWLGSVRLRGNRFPMIASSPFFETMIRCRRKIRRGRLQD